MPFCYGLSETLFAGGNEPGWNLAAYDLILKNQIGVSGRFNVTGYPAVLSGSSGLLFVGIVEFGFSGYGFPVCNTRLTGNYLGGVLAAHPFNIEL